MPDDLHEHVLPSVAKHAHPLEHKVIMVTGATSGIGEVTARELARRGAHVLLAGRNPDRCREAFSRIRSEVPEASLEWVDADLSSIAQVRRLAGRVLALTPRLDGLVNNAGCYRSTRKVTEDGIEETWAVNYLAPFLLTRLLLPSLEASPSARVVNVSSEAHRHARPDWMDLVGSPHYSGLRAYAETKLALLMFTYELARRLSGTRVTVNALHPGVVHTQFGSHGEGVRRWVIRKAIEATGLSPEEGAQTTIYLAGSPDLEGVSGQYFAHSVVVASSEVSRDPLRMHQLWTMTEKLLQLPPMPPLDEEPAAGVEAVEAHGILDEPTLKNPTMVRITQR